MDFSDTNWATLALATGLMTASCTAFSLVIGNLTIVMNDFLAVKSFATGIILGLTGVIIPVSNLPVGLRQLSQILPLTHGIDAFRSSFAGATVEEVGASLGLELVVGVGYAVIGYFAFRYLEKEARRLGTIEAISGHVPSSGVRASPSRSNQAVPAGSNIGSSMRSAVPTSKTGAAR